MRTVSVFIVACLLSLHALAQSEKSVPDSKASKLKAERLLDQISARPTRQELLQLFDATWRGDLDPFLAIPRIAQKGESAVLGLGTLLSDASGSPESADPENSGRDTPLDEGLVKLRAEAIAIYALRALDAIGTPDAFDVIVGVAKNAVNLEVHGYALQILASSYYNHIVNAGQEPDNRVVDLLVHAIQEKAQNSTLHKSVGQIAQEGVKNWLGEDWGIEGAHEELGIQVEQWWATAKNRLKWNGAKRLFETL